MDTGQLMDLKPGAIIEVGGVALWVRIENVSDTYFAMEGMFVNMYNGELQQAEYLAGAKLVSNGPNYVMDIILEGWEE